MPLLVEQLIYTSFSKIGFKCFTSDHVPLAIKRAFSEQIVDRHWDTYDPPEAGFRAAYVQQLSSNQTLFGWLYNDGTDDFGRSNIPYFICYYIAESLTPFLLDKIITCLETGPVDLIDRRYAPDNLESLLIPDFCLYDAPMRGVAIGSEIRQQSHNNLKQKKYINLFATGENALLTQPKPTDIKSQLSDCELAENSTQPFLVLPSATEPENSPVLFLSAHKIEAVLRELIAKPIGVEGVVLVSHEGHPIIPPIGLNDNSSLIMSGTMLYLVKSAQEEFDWQNIETISIKGSQGHIILAACNLEMYLLVKAGKAITGLLEAEIKRTIKKLNAAMETQLEQGQKTLLETNNQSTVSQPLPELTANLDSLSSETILEELPAEIPLEADPDIRYRGRRTSL